MKYMKEVLIEPRPTISPVSAILRPTSVLILFSTYSFKRYIAPMYNEMMIAKFSIVVSEIGFEAYELTENPTTHKKTH